MLILYLLIITPLSKPLALPLLYSENVPVVHVDQENRLHLGLPQSVLEHAEVKAHLRTGLTTTFVHRVSVRLAGGTREVMARLDIRYELWDEVFLVTLHTGLAPTELFRFSGMEELEHWWRGSNLVLGQLPENAEILSDVRVVVEVLPFSASEQKEAQRWFSNTGNRGQSNDSNVEADAFDLFLTTSIKRNPLLSFRWDVAVSTLRPK